MAASWSSLTSNPFKPPCNNYGQHNYTQGCLSSLIAIGGQFNSGKPIRWQSCLFRPGPSSSPRERRFLLSWALCPLGACRIGFVAQDLQRLDWFLCDVTSCLPLFAVGRRARRRVPSGEVLSHQAVAPRLWKSIAVVRWQHEDVCISRSRLPLPARDLMKRPNLSGSVSSNEQERGRGDGRLTYCGS